MELLHRGETLFCCFFFLLLVVPYTTLAASSYLGRAYGNCMLNATNGTPLSTTYQHNLNIVWQNFTSMSSQGTKYAKTSAGSGDDMVYAMFQCRGDQSTPLCAECIANATVRLPQRDCPTSIGARIQLDGCYLRYSNQSFFILDVTEAISYCYAESRDSFILSIIDSLVDNVTTKAPKQGGFASANAHGEYAAAQCLGYLNESECSECLSTVPYRLRCDSTLGEQVHLTSCYYRFEPYAFLEPLPSPPPGVSPMPTPAPAPAPARAKASMSPPVKASVLSRTGFKIAASVASIIVAAILVCVILAWRRKASKKTGKKELRRQASWPQPVIQTKARVFSLQELEAATRNFHLGNKLGEGGYGSVYKGTLSNGEQVAVKKLANCSRQGVPEFLNEVNLITRVQHKNLIRLLGCCTQESERILVYEYLSNKSLDLMLFGQQQDGKTLDWQVRYGIILGTAKGLAYLHEESHIRIIHRDIKPSNILLGYQLNPVIADFGLARLLQDGETHVRTRVAGTRGYMAPEYAIRGELSEKADVYSFGVVLLEILSGRQNFNNQTLEWFISYTTMWSAGRHFRISRLDTKRTTQDSGVMATFENANGEMEEFCGILMNILKFDYRTFNIYALDVKWFKEPLRRSINANIRRHASGILAIDSTKVWETSKDSFVLPQHCEQVVYQPDIIDQRWWYVIQVSPRSKAIYQKTDFHVMEEVGVETSPNQSDDGDVEVDLQAASREENVIEEEVLQNDGLIDGSGRVEVEDEDDEEQLGYEDVEDDQESSIGINLFVDLHSMGLEVDQSTIRDLCDDFIDEEL